MFLKKWLGTNYGTTQSPLAVSLRRGCVLIFLTIIINLKINRIDPIYSNTRIFARIGLLEI
jgi:hypothetical protein